MQSTYRRLRLPVLFIMTIMGLGALIPMSVAHAQDAAVVASTQPVQIYAEDAVGHVICMTEMPTNLPNCSMYMGDPLTIAFNGNPDAACPIDEDPDGWKYQHVNYGVAVRRQDSSNRVTVPLRPTGLFYHVTLDGGVDVILRVHEDFPLTIAKASYLDKEYELTSISALEALRIQTSGDAPVSKPLPDFVTRTTLLDAESIEAYSSKDDARQRQLLDEVAGFTAELLEEYKSKQGQYPLTLCRLVKGDKTIISDMPRNPYDFPVCIGQSDTSNPPARGFIRYYAQTAADDPSAVVGYWIAIIADGDTTTPQVPLPAGMPMPFKAVKWLEHHPE
jgi:hypothetical protein